MSMSPRSSAFLLAVALTLVTPLGLVACGGGGAGSGAEGSLAFAWPPVEGRPYPDLELTDFRGEVVRLSSFRGKVLLIEPIGMT